MKLVILLLTIAIYLADSKSHCNYNNCKSCSVRGGDDCVWCDGKCLSSAVKIACSERIDDVAGCPFRHPCLLDSITSVSDGAVFVKPGDCNTCQCNNGELICTKKACPPRLGCDSIDCKEGTFCVMQSDVPVCVTKEPPHNPCETVKCESGHRCVASNDGTVKCVPIVSQPCTHNSFLVHDGDSFAADDGCNTCYCRNGLIECTQNDCTPHTCTNDNGVTYKQGDIFPSPDKCNECTCTERGIIVCTEKACPVFDCSPVKNCVAGHYCSYEGLCPNDSTNTLGTTNLLGKCTIMPDFCTMEYNPVCGCNGKTYSNECHAAVEGQNVRAAGECKATTA